MKDQIKAGREFMAENETVFKQLAKEENIMTQHTKTPWKIEKRTDKEYTSDPSVPQYRLYSAAPLTDNDAPGSDYNIAVIDNEIDAAFIVRACNNHDALVEALRETTHWLALTGVPQVGALEALNAANVALTNAQKP